MSKIIISSVIIIVLVILTSMVLIYDKNKLISNPLLMPPASQSSPTSTDHPQTEILAENLSVPWDIAFLPNGDILFTERGGAVKRFYLSSDKHVETVGTIENVLQVGESGLHGIAIHPEFSKNNYIYLYYTYEKEGENTTNRVSRFTYSDNGLSDESIIVDEIPGAMFHDGGRLRFGPDGFLYITTGDAQEPSLAQDRNSLAGKILRVTDEGEPAQGNPFGNAIYSYGHRNPQGITWDDNGNIWETEHGNQATDEVNMIEPGNNYGWPIVTGSQSQSGMISPVIQSGLLTTWAPASVAYLNGSLYFGGLRGQALYEAPITGEAISEVIPHFQERFGRIRAVTLGPDNLLYIATSNRDGRGNPRTGDDKIIRVNLEKL